MGIKGTILFFLVFLLLPTFAFSANWSRFITTQNRDDVTISFRQKKINNAWTVEWRVNNGSQAVVEPFLKTRNYLCGDDNSLLLLNTSFGRMLPGIRRRGDIIDTNICPNSTIKLVEIETEIIDNFSPKVSLPQ